MSITSKSTKAELLAELQAVKENAVAWMERAKKAEKVIIPEPDPVPEAEALAGAINALDKVRTRSNNYNNDYRPDTTAIALILKHLAAKYGVPLVEVKYEPCARQHLDDIDTIRMADAIRGGGFSVR